MGNDREERGDDPEGTEIKVTDRRLFTTDGNLRHDLADSDEEEPQERATVSGAAPSARTGSGARDADSPEFERRSLEEPEGVDFTMLINAMAQPALIFLGEVPHPGTGRPEVNLEQARLQIDLLDVLRIKSRGNLSPEEEGLLDRMLYQLRMLYVTRSNQPSS